MLVRLTVALAIGLFVGAAWFSSLAGTTSIAEAANAQRAPAFTHKDADDWINSVPLNWNQLRGKVVLLDVWTFSCWNCYRSFPWLKNVEETLGKENFEIIGIHSPEFDHEKVHASVAAKVEEFGLEHPVMIDNDFSYWRALGNRFWPTFYIVDKRGRLRASFIGETHKGDNQARKIESTIRSLLAES